MAHRPFGAVALVWLLKVVLGRCSAILKTLRDLQSCPGRGRLLYDPFGGLSLAMDRFSPYKWHFHDYHAAFDRTLVRFQIFHHADDG
ncbi:hypothetical protein L218DRAFT_126151 [Marasmius fiardii PR-910]|nr:hypothetical protein L218DRAFT_126151 [Marasmius fiardii PR-910]